MRNNGGLFGVPIRLVWIILMDTIGMGKWIIKRVTTTIIEENVE